MIKFVNEPSCEPFQPCMNIYYILTRKLQGLKILWVKLCNLIQAVNFHTAWVIRSVFHPFLSLWILHPIILHKYILCHAHNQGIIILFVSVLRWKTVQYTWMERTGRRFFVYFWFKKAETTSPLSKYSLQKTLKKCVIDTGYAYVMLWFSFRMSEYQLLGFLLEKNLGGGGGRRQ